MRLCNYDKRFIDFDTEPTVYIKDTMLQRNNNFRRIKVMLDKNVFGVVVDSIYYENIIEGTPKFFKRQGEAENYHYELFLGFERQGFFDIDAVSDYHLYPVRRSKDEKVLFVSNNNSKERLTVICLDPMDGCDSGVEYFFNGTTDDGLLKVENKYGEIREYDPKRFKLKFCIQK